MKKRTTRCRRKKRWGELSGRQRAAICTAATVQIGLLVGALLDLRRRPSDRVNGPKPLWAAISFVNFVGPLAYFAFGRKRGPAQAKSPEPTQSPGPGGPTPPDR